MGDVTIVDLAGLPKDADAAKDGRIIAAIANASGSTLFFNVRGNAELTEAQKGDFIKWVAAVCNAQSDNKPPPMAGMMEAPDSKPPQLEWKAPPEWTEAPATSMRYASFNVSGANGENADISV